MAGIRFKNKNIHYKVLGQGQPVLLLHGFGENGEVFSKQTEFLKDKFKVVVPDLPGSGQSEKSDVQRGMEEFADVVFQIAEEEFGEEKFTLLGHSMGGYITMAFVERYEKRLRSFGLLHSSSYADTEEKKEARRKAIEFINGHGGNAFLKTIIPDLFSDESKEKYPDFIKKMTSLANDIRDETLIHYYNAMISRPDRRGLLKSTRLPVLFTIGIHDKAVPADLTLQQSRFPVLSSVVVLEHSGHVGMWEEADKTNQAILHFLQGF